MSARFWPQSVADKQRSIVRRYLLPAALVAGAFLIQGCTSVPPQPFAGADASDPNHRVPSVGYRPVLGGYSSQRPVEPLPWTERNRSVTPPTKKDGQ